MSFLLVQHKVKDYAKWKPLFDEHGATRKQAGCQFEQVYCDSSEPNNVFMLFEWDNADNARRFSESEDLKQVMERAGVIGAPEIRYVDVIERRKVGEGVSQKVA